MLRKADNEIRNEFTYWLTKPTKIQENYPERKSGIQLVAYKNLAMVLSKLEPSCEKMYREWR